MIISIIAVLVAVALIAAALILFLSPQSSDQDFLNALASGLDERWANEKDSSEMTLQELSEYYQELVNYELDTLNGYENKVYKDAQLKEYAISYIDALKKSEEAAKQLVDDEGASWNTCYDNRILILYNIDKEYGINVQDRETLDIVLADAKAVLASQNGNSDQQPQGDSSENSDKNSVLQAMVNNMRFERVSDSTVEGVIENTTDYNFESVKFDFKFYDRDGVVVYSGSEIEFDWPAGEKRKIQITCYEFFADYDFIVYFR